MRPFVFSLAAAASLAGCGFSSPDTPDDAAPDAAITEASRCAAGHAGAACVLALYDRAAASCDPSDLADLTLELDARETTGPLWANGRALFRASKSLQIAGTFNDWTPTAVATARVCSSPIFAAIASVPSGFHTYKLVDGTAWSLDPLNPAFAYDDFSGNADGKNSVLNTPDSGRGHLVAFERACSATLGNCRDVTAYLPPGYHAPANATSTYPVLFLHDGQNVWDDHDCCYGHTGWEVNVALDTEIAAGRVAPVVVIAAAHSADRNNEYGLSSQKLAAFMAFQTSELEPHALANVRGNGRLFVGGSSLGGLVSMRLGLANPQRYAGVISLSGSYQVGKDTGTAVRDQLPAIGKQDLAVYLDHGGVVVDGTDNSDDNVELRDLLVTMGWQRSDSPCSAAGPSSLCYFHEVGAAHDELAWKARTWRFLRYAFAP